MAKRMQKSVCFSESVKYYLLSWLLLLLLIEFEGIATNQHVTTID
jgi:hypothetical protein